MIALLLLNLFVAMANENFTIEALQLTEALKQGLMSELQKQVKVNGPVAAVEFCKLNVKPLAKTAAGKMIEKYSFGRTSHKIRNSENASQKWVEPYLAEFKVSKSKNAKRLVHDGKQVLLTPLYIQPLCLQCHGEKIASNVEEKISQLYPGDQARGFKVGEFRGFIWVKEK